MRRTNRHRVPERDFLKKNERLRRHRGVSNGRTHGKRSRPTGTFHQFITGQQQRRNSRNIVGNPTARVGENVGRYFEVQQRNDELGYTNDYEQVQRVPGKTYQRAIVVEKRFE